MRCAMRHAADDASALRIVRAANARGAREGRIGGRERGCAKKAATAEVAVMPLEQAGGRVFRTALVSCYTKDALGTFQDIIPFALEDPRSR